jgi:hypothetical protein
MFKFLFLQLPSVYRKPARGIGDAAAALAQTASAAGSFALSWRRHLDIDTREENAMLGSTVLEVAVGLIFCYATVALIVSSLQEALASALGLRARGLLAGVKTMLNDPQFNALARAVYSHALVNPLDDGHALVQRKLKATPSYIASRDFATALVDSIASVPGDFAKLGRDIDAVPDAQVRRVLQTMYRRAAGDADSFQELVAQWFDGAMERVSGAYKRRALLISLGLTFAVAAVFNVDSIHLFSTLWNHAVIAGQVAEAARAAVAAGPDASGAHAIETLCALPIGWCSVPPLESADFAWRVAGWAITAATGLFGAQAWFDLLQHVVNLRATGARPAPLGPVGVDQHA